MERTIHKEASMFWISAALVSMGHEHHLMIGPLAEPDQLVDKHPIMQNQIVLHVKREVSGWLGCDQKITGSGWKQTWVLQRQSVHLNPACKAFEHVRQDSITADEHMTVDLHTA
ncbi:hypothetical protein [Synechococcus sp. J7-Johnson]|uniref:hypothetical protein n=1 Tax=Synechococcus sp. J7-Johnson TaxID=2823737 RepID=UPI0020CEA562|nr:hypothetical protein [Synechococcus sp. J7-Johnson]